MDLQISGIVWCVGAATHEVNVSVCDNEESSDPTTAGKIIASIQRAVDIAGPGDEIFIASGTYTSTGSAVVTVDESVFLRGGFNPGATGWDVVDPAGTVLNGLAVRPGIVVSGSPEVIVDDINLINGGLVNSSGQVKVKGGRLVLQSGTTTAAIEVKSDGLLVLERSSKLAQGSVISGPGVTQIPLVPTGSDVDIVGDTEISNLEMLTGSRLKGEGDLTITMSMKWTGGRLDGDGALIVGEEARMETLAILSGYFPLYRPLVNRGFLEWKGTVGWQVGDTPAGIDVRLGGSIENQSGALMEVTGGGSLARSAPTGGFGYLENAGTLIIKPGAATDVELDSVTFNNTGAVEVQSGRVIIKRGGVAGPGSTFSCGSAAEVDLVGANYQWQAGAGLDCAGTLRLMQNQLIVDGSVTVANYEQVGSSVVGLTGTGSLAITGQMTWGDGYISSSGLDLVIRQLAVLHIQGTETLIVGAGALNLEGTANWLSGDLQVNGSIEIEPGGSLKARSDQTMLGAGLLVNQGTIVKEETSGTTLITVGAIDNSAGALRVEDGILEISGDLDIPSAIVSIGGPLVGTQHGQIRVGDEVTFSGTLEVFFSDATPVLDQEYGIVAYGFRGGSSEFATYLGLDSGGGLGSGLELAPVYDDLNQELRLVVVPTQ